jgi:pimeloyl-ACP methyl ester carboxylesterase
MKPKPPADEHRAMLWRCLCEGIRRARPEIAADIAGKPEIFRLASWASLFYEEQRDIAIDLPGVERMFRLPGAELADIAEARHWHKRIGRLIYLLCDAFPGLIDFVANPDMKTTLVDIQRYFRNEQAVAERIRTLVADCLLDIWREGHEILLIGHSLGSVIAYDVLWDLSRRRNSDLRIDLFMTIGSPLGLNFVRHRLLSAHEHGARRFPSNIRRWENLSAIGEMTALDRVFANDYAPMLKHGLLESINDHTHLTTYFRGEEGLNVHKCYGYMINEQVGAVVADWLE